MRVRDALTAGFTASELRRAGRAPFWGIRAFSAPSDELAARCRDFAPRLGAAFYSHVTAAGLWGLPLPRRLDDSLLHVAFTRGHRAADTRDAVGHQLRVEPQDLAILGNLPLTSVARTIRDLAPLLDVPDLVAVVDHALRVGMTTRDELARQAGVRGFRGRPRLSVAVRLADRRAESRQESLLRVALLRAGIGDLTVNEEIRTRDGGFIARVDLRVLGTPVILEYDGDGHRTDARQWRRDVERYARLEDLGFVVVRVTAADSPAFSSTIERVRAVLRRGELRPSAVEDRNS